MSGFFRDMSDEVKMGTVVVCAILTAISLFATGIMLHNEQNYKESMLRQQTRVLKEKAYIACIKKCENGNTSCLIVCDNRKN